MSLPPFAAFPPPAIWETLPATQRDGFLDLWTSLASVYLALSPDKFAAACQTSSSVVKFITSLYTSFYSLNVIQRKTLSRKDHALLEQASSLTSRAILNLSIVPEDFCQWRFLAAFCHAHRFKRDVPGLLQKLWTANHGVVRASLKSLRRDLERELVSTRFQPVLNDLRQLAPLLHTLPQAGGFLAEGSEFLDALDGGYVLADLELRSIIAPVAYLILASLLTVESRNLSALVDHVYGLKASAEKSRAEVSLLADLVTNTPLVARLRGVTNEKGAQRAIALADSLGSFRVPSLARRRPAVRRRTSKGKGVAKSQGENERHVHLLSKITQVQDLFPDLGPGFVSQLLDEYHEDVEIVTMHLLEESLPPHLNALDRTLQLPNGDPKSTERRKEAIDDLIPASTPVMLPERRNVFDNDEFDRLEIDEARYHTGRRDGKMSADDVLADRSRAPNKASIMSALAAFDSDDDERDDTYDETDVGGTVDKAGPDGEDNEHVDIGGDSNDEALFRAWRMDPRAFERGHDGRRSAARQKLKLDTGLTDEAIEGWAIMLSREPKRLRRLEAQYSAFDGHQSQLQRTSFRQEREDGDETGSDSQAERSTGGFPRGRGGGRGRGRGRGRGGNVADEAGDAQTQTARHRKEASKGSRANHNRRDQRAKKLARGGFPG